MTIENDAEDDGGAAQAFVELRAEVTVMRRAVEGLPAIVSSLEPPDYSQSFGAIGKALANVETRLAKIEGHPAFKITPDQYSWAIRDAGAPIIQNVVSAVQATIKDLNQAKQDFFELAMRTRAYRELTVVKRLLLGVGIVAGLILYPILGVFAPGGSYLGAWATGNSGRWNAGFSLLQASNPVGAQAITYTSHLVSANIKVFNACLAAARKAGAVQKCTIEVLPSTQ